MDRLLTLLLMAGLLSCSEVRPVDLPLANGSNSQAYELVDGNLHCLVAPALGAKIISLRHGETEWLSRSERPHVSRMAGDQRLETYGDSAFDGIDECFPTVSKTTYPLAPWKDTPIDDHGEVWNQAWQVVSSTDSLRLQATGRSLPFTMERTASLTDGKLILDYRISNNGDADIAWHYAFHPLFAAASGAALEMPDDMPCRISYSKGGAIGLNNTTLTWQELRAQAFTEGQFVTGSKRWYKYVAGPFTEGLVRYHHANGETLVMRWDAGVLPYLAVWVSEGGVDGLHHIGAEPTTSPYDSLEAVVKANQHRSLPAKGEQRWQISLEPGVATDE